MTEPLLDLVAVAYEAPQETEAFLASLVHVDVPFRLLVIDNASPNPDVRPILESRLGSWQTGVSATSPLTDVAPNCVAAGWHASATNHGYARGVNLGMSMLVGPAPFAGILNCDVQFLPEGIGDMMAHFVSHPEVGVLAPRTFTSGSRLLTHAGIVTTPDNPHNHHRAWLQPDTGAYRDIRPVNTVSGATYFVRRAMWDQLAGCVQYLDAAPGALGAFLPTQHFFEETFCSYHAKAHGWQVVYHGPSAMIHEWHRSSALGSQDFETPRRLFLDACAAHGITPDGEL